LSYISDFEKISTRETKQVLNEKRSEESVNVEQSHPELLLDWKKDLSYSLDFSQVPML
jgi:hypothetical protein